MKTIILSAYISIVVAKFLAKVPSFVHLLLSAVFIFCFVVYKINYELFQYQFQLTIYDFFWCNFLALLVLIGIPLFFSFSIKGKKRRRSVFAFLSLFVFYIVFELIFTDKFNNPFLIFCFFGPLYGIVFRSFLYVENAKSVNRLYNFINKNKNERRQCKYRTLMSKYKKKYYFQNFENFLKNIGFTGKSLHEVYFGSLFLLHVFFISYFYSCIFMFISSYFTRLLV